MIALLLTLVLAAPLPKGGAHQPADAECVDACQWAWGLCADLAVWLFLSEPGAVGEKLYRLQMEACFESWGRCVEGC